MGLETLFSLARAAGHDAPPLRKDVVSGEFSTTEWYLRNGYNTISRELGYSRSITFNGAINETQALQVAAFFACVKIISEDMGTMPLIMYERSADLTETQKAIKNALFALLKDLTNPEMSAGEFVETMTSQAVMHGTAYARIDRNVAGNVIALWPLKSKCMKLERNANGVTVYVYRDGSEPEQRYSRKEIFHLRGFTMDGQQGVNILEIARRVIGLSAEQAEYAYSFFANDHTPGIVLEHPGKPGPEGVKNIKKMWRDNVASHDVAVTQEGMKVNVIGATNEASQLIEQRRFQIAEICRIFRMPPHKLAEMADATFSNIESQSIEYITQTLNPWIRRWKQAVHRCLLTDAEQREGRLYAEHDVTILMRGDFASQTASFAAMLDRGAFSINDVLRALNRNPIKGGDTHFVPMNMQTLEDAESGKNLPANARAAPPPTMTNPSSPKSDAPFTLNFTPPTPPTTAPPNVDVRVVMGNDGGFKKRQLTRDTFGNITGIEETDGEVTRRSFVTRDLDGEIVGLTAGQ